MDLLSRVTPDPAAADDADAAMNVFVSPWSVFNALAMVNIGVTAGQFLCNFPSST